MCFSAVEMFIPREGVRGTEYGNTLCSYFINGYLIVQSVGITE